MPIFHTVLIQVKADANPEAAKKVRIMTCWSAVAFAIKTDDGNP